MIIYITRHYYRAMLIAIIAADVYATVDYAQFFFCSPLLITLIADTTALLMPAITLIAFFLLLRFRHNITLFFAKHWCYRCLFFNILSYLLFTIVGELYYIAFKDTPCRRAPLISRSRAADSDISPLATLVGIVLRLR